MKNLKKIHKAQQLVGLAMFGYLCVMLFQSANTILGKIIVVFLLLLLMVIMIKIDPISFREKEVTTQDIKAGYVALLLMLFLLFATKITFCN